MKTECLNSFSESFIEQWDAFLAVHAQGSVMQSHFAFRLFAATKNFAPVFLRCTDSSGRLLGVLLGVVIRESGGLLGKLSARTVVYGGPVIVDDSPERNTVFRQLCQALISEVRHQSLFIQFRASYDMSEFNSEFDRLHFERTPRMNLLVDTSSLALVKQGISASRWRQIKQSLRKGAEIIEPQDLEQVRDFYNILYQLYRYKVKKPLPDFSFFEAFWQLSKVEGYGKIFLIRYQNQIIGGIMSPCSSGKTVYEWYVCGMDAEYKMLGIYPSVLATWAAIEFAISSGCPQFDFMGVGKPDVPYGVRDFKMRFGGETVNYGRYVRINNRFLYSIAELGFNLLSLFKKI